MTTSPQEPLDPKPKSLRDELPEIIERLEARAGSETRFSRMLKQQLADSIRVGDRSAKEVYRAQLRGFPSRQAPQPDSKR
jgi:hypothetical protein